MVPFSKAKLLAVIFAEGLQLALMLRLKHVDVSAVLLFQVHHPCFAALFLRGDPEVCARFLEIELFFLQVLDLVGKGIGGVACLSFVLKLGVGRERSLREDGLVLLAEQGCEHIRGWDLWLVALKLKGALVVGRRQISRTPDVIIALHLTNL